MATKEELRDRLAQVEDALEEIRDVISAALGDDEEPEPDEEADEGAEEEGG